MGTIFLVVVNKEPFLSSMLAAGIVQDTFAGEAGEGFVAIEFLSQITNTHTCIRNVRTYVFRGGGGGGSLR